MTRCFGRMFLSLFCIIWALPIAVGEERVRIATYNIEFLKPTISAQRAAKLKAVIASLDADIIGLQEIENLAALERVFDPTEWSLVIDDQSNDNQDVAAANPSVRNVRHAVALDERR